MTKRPLRVLFVVHERYEAPGAYARWATDRRHSIRQVLLYNGERLPTQIEDVDLLVVMGGPQRPTTRREECAYFDAKAERELIARAVAAGKIVLGACLGSQLIGEALGAAFEESPNREVGNFPILLTDAGRDDRHCSHLDRGEQGFVVGHWHQDMPGLTAEAKVLAQSAGCPRQIVRYSNLVYGLQCHLEFTKEVVAMLVDVSHDDLKRWTGLPYVQEEAVLLSNAYEEMNGALFTFLDNHADTYSAAGL